MTELFYVFGGVLTVVALVLSFVGLRSEGFPTSRGLYAGVLAGLGVLVIAACGFAIALAREEADHRAHEVAEFEAEQEAEVAEERPEEPESESQEGASQIETETKEAAPLEVSSPAEGDLIFEPDALESEAGEITIAYTNPSEVPHNVAIEADGQTLAESETVTGGDTGEASAPLEPGEYVFFCAIPGHRESGMEGTLTVE